MVRYFRPLARVGDRIHGIARDNFAERRSVRDFMEELRGAGVQTGAPPGGIAAGPVAGCHP